MKNTTALRCVCLCFVALFCSTATANNEAPIDVDGPPPGQVRYVYFNLTMNKRDNGKMELYDRNKRSMGDLRRQQYHLWYCYLDGPDKLDREVVFKRCGATMKPLGTDQKNLGAGVYVMREKGINMEGTVFKALKVRKNEGFNEWGKKSGDWVNFYFRGHEIVK